MALAPLSMSAITPTKDRDRSGRLQHLLRRRGNSRSNRCRIQGSCVDVLGAAVLVCVAEIRRRCAFAVHAG